MKTVKKLGAQGDVLFRAIGCVPKDAVLQPPTERIVVAHSETGHDHVIEDALGLRHYRSANPLVDYLEIPRPRRHADVVHRRSSDTHETARLTQRVYEVRRQREWTPEGWRRVQD